MIFDDFTAPPTVEQMEQAFGFTPPPALVHLLLAIFPKQTSESNTLGNAFDQLTGLYLGNYEDRYATTPIELFPFGRTGADGIHLGYIIHDEKLGPDYPVALADPNYPTVTIVAPDTKSIFDLLLSGKLGADQDDSIARVAAMLGISPAAEKVDPENYWQFQPQFAPPPPLTLPAGWKLAKLPDMIGVAAPADLFAPDQDFEQEFSENPDEIEQYEYEDYVTWAEQAEEAGHLGTALYHLRFGYYFCGADNEIDASIGNAMYRVYKKLGRDLHAKHIQQALRGGEEEEEDEDEDAEEES